MRILQGLSVGGEYSGALIYAIEHFEKKYIGMIGGLVICGCITGAMIATIVSKIVQLPFLPEYSWRFAFLLGTGLSFIGYFIRKNLVETPEFTKLSIDKSKIPLLEGIKTYPIQCIAATLAAAANGVNFYFILVFLPNYINQLIGVEISYYPTLSTAILIILSPIFGYISDKIDRIKLISYGLLGLAFYSFFGLQIVEMYPKVEIAIMFFCGQAIIFATQAATVNIFIIEIFPTKYRYSCSSFCYSVGLGLIGGTSPLVATLIIEQYGKEANFYISSYMFVVSILGYLGILLIKAIHQKNKKLEKSSGYIVNT
jgi:MHS family proline/betaine transporter-like MFS transporter